MVKGLLKEKFTVVWNNIVILISGSSYPPKEMFLIRYSLQAAVHGIWRERNSRRHVEEPKDVRILSKLVDKTIRLHLLAVKARVKHIWRGGCALVLELGMFQTYHEKIEGIFSLIY